MGTATVTIQGIGNYTGTIIKKFAIKQVEIDNFTVNGVTQQTYTGKEILVPFTITDESGNQLVYKQDYDFVYSDNIEVGTATIMIQGKGSYTGSIEVEFEIVPQSIETAEITGIVDTMEYTGNTVLLQIGVTNNGLLLVESEDYTVTYENHIEVGTATVTIQGIGNYTGTIEREFEIVKIDISNFVVTGITNQVYTGEEINLPITVVDENGKSLVYKHDCDWTYSNNTSAGIATITINGIGNYTGTITETFTINPVVLTVAGVTLSESSYVYDGIAKQPVIIVRNGNDLLVNNKDYRVVYAKNTAIGTATVTITGIGNYRGTIRKTFKIIPGQVTGLKQSGTRSAASTTLSWTAVSGASGYEIYRSTSKNGLYTRVKYQSAVTYKNTGLSAGSRYYYKIRAYKTINKTKVYGAYSKIISAMTLPKAPKVTLTTSTGAITATWTQVSGSKGYELYMATSKNGAYTRIKNANATTLSYKKSGLSTGKAYYFKVRSYIKDATGKKVFSNFSSVVSGMKIPKAPALKLTTSKNTIKASWSKVVGCKGYELYMATAANGTYTRIKSGNASVISYTKTGLTLGTTYYFKIRSYVTNASGKKIYSSYSTVKSIKLNSNPVVGEWTIDADKTLKLNNESLWSYFGTSIKYGYRMTLQKNMKMDYYIAAGNGGAGTYKINGNQIIYDLEQYEGGKETGTMQIYNAFKSNTYIIMNFHGYKIHWVKE